MVVGKLVAECKVKKLKITPLACDRLVSSNLCACPCYCLAIDTHRETYLYFEEVMFCGID